MVAEGTIDQLRTTETAQLALAIGAPKETVAEALRPLGITVEDDPKAGTAEAPHIPGATRVLFNQPTSTDDQSVLRAALAVGAVHEFGPRRPHLTDLFKDVVVTVPPIETEAPPKKRGVLGGLGRNARKERN